MEKKYKTSQPEYWRTTENRKNEFGISFILPFSFSFMLFKFLGRYLL